MDNLRKTRGITLHYTELLPPPELVFLGAERDVLNSHDNPLRQLSAVPVPVNAHQPLGPALLPHGADQPASSRELFKQVGRDRRGRGAHVDAVVRRALQVSPSAVTEHEDELPRVQEGPRAWIPPAVLLAGPVQAGDVLQTDRQPSLPSHHVRHHRGQVTAAAPHLFVYTVIVESERGARRRKRDFCRGQPRPLSLSLSLSSSKIRVCLETHRPAPCSRASESLASAPNSTRACGERLWSPRTRWPVARPRRRSAYPWRSTLDPPLEKRAKGRDERDKTCQKQTVERDERQGRATHAASRSRRSPTSRSRCPAAPARGTRCRCRLRSRKRVGGGGEGCVSPPRPPRVERVFLSCFCSYDFSRTWSVFPGAVN